MSLKMETPPAFDEFKAEFSVAVYRKIMEEVRDSPEVWFRWPFSGDPSREVKRMGLRWHAKRGNWRVATRPVIDAKGQPQIQAWVMFHQKPAEQVRHFAAFERRAS